MNAFLIPGIIIAAVAALRGLWSPCGLSMISTITPVAERGRGHRFGATATWFTLGGVAGGATLGAAMALGAWLVSLTGASTSLTVGVFACLALLTVASDLGLGGFSLPIHARQVNETWLRRLRPWAYASGFGWQIGTGFATYIMTSAVYLTAAVGIASADPIVALGIGTFFGSVRGLLVFVAARATDHARLQRLHARIDRYTDSTLYLAIGAQLVAVGALALTSHRPLLLAPVALGALTAFVAGRKTQRDPTFTPSAAAGPGTVLR